MVLTKEQEELVIKQLKRHDRCNVKGRIDLGRGVSLEIFIARGIFGSDIMSSGIYLARFLYKHKNLYTGRVCLDLGCGPGTQGLVIAINGAKQVDLSDINQNAVKNTKENITFHHLKGKCKAYVSDLFKNLPKGKKYDVVVFNHPFFPEDAKNFGKEVFDDEMLRRSMLGGTELIKKFFREVKNYLKDNESIIIMPYFHFAGKENNPANHVGEYSFYVQNEEKIISQQGLQLGDFSLYIIKQDFSHKSSQI